MKAAFLTAFTCMALAVGAQLHYYQLKPKVPNKYAYNADSVYKQMLTVKDPQLKEKTYQEYSESQAYYHDRMLNSGLVYFDWSEIENYLTGLVARLSTASGANRQFKVFLLRNEDVNASAQDNGIIYINIGLLAEMKDEAALVSVLAHELSHAIHSDTKKNYEFYGRQAKKPKVRDVLQATHQNRSFEARADQDGFATAVELNYDITSCYHTFIKFESEYRWYKSQYQYQNPKWYIALDRLQADKNVSADSLETYLLDHPENSRRLKILNNYIQLKNGSNRFSGNEAFFNDMKYKARMEQLYIDFSEASYLYCLHNAFYYHLLDQQDQNYLYYITECLRRLVLADPALKRKGFLTDDSKEKVFDNDKGILHDLSFVSLDTVFLAKMKTDAVYGANEKPFETYFQAYAYFYKLAKAAQVPGLSLGAGLFELSRNRKEKGTELLKKYLELPDAPYRDFATAIVDDRLLADLKDNKNDLVYIDEPEYYTLSNGNTKYSYLESSRITGRVIPRICAEFRPNRNLPVKFLVADSLNIVEYNKYEDLLENFRFFKPEKEAELERNAGGAANEDYWKAKEANDPLDPEILKRNKNFFYLEPGYWKLFKDEQIHSFTYIKPYFYRHKLLGTIFFFEIAYFDPVDHVYVYFDQEYAETFTDGNVSSVFKRFYTKLKEQKLNLTH